MRIAALLLVLLASLLGGCRITAFEHAPVTAQACDRQLAGHWLSVGDAPGQDGEVALRIDDDCRMQVDEHEHGGVRGGDATQVELGRQDGHSYAWVDAGWAQQRFDPESRDLQPRSGDVYLVRYQLAGDRLTLHAPDSVVIAHAIIDGDIPGEVRYGDSRLHNRIIGAAQPELLQRESFFDAQAIVFRRAQTEPAQQAPKLP